MIKIDNINIKYDRVLLNDSSITLKNNCLHLIKGPSGCGKTSLLYLIGMISHQSCNYYVNDKIVKNYEKFKQQIGFVFQEAVLVDYLSVEDHIKLFKSFFTNIDENRLIELVHLEVNKKELVKNLSGGERQRLAIVLALLKNPKILIVDEPTSALDEKNKIQILNILKDISNRGICIVMTSHDTTAEKWADIIYKIEDEKIILIKDCEKSVQLNASFNYSSMRTFYYRYLRSYIKYHLKLFVLLIVLIGIVVSFFNSNSVILNEFIQIQKDYLNTTTDNQMLVMSDQEIKTQLLKIKEIKNLIPFSEIKTTYKDVQFYIQPYIDEKKMINKKDIQFNDSPIFISYSLFHKIQTNEISCTINNQEVHFDIGYVLDKNYTNFYTDNGNYILYLPYNIFKSYEKEQTHQFLIEYKSFYNKSKVENEIKKIGNVDIKDNNYENITAMIESIEYIQSIGIVISLLIIIIVGILMGMIYYQNVKNNSGSYAYLAANGIGKNKLLISNYIWLLIMSFLGTILSLVFQEGYVLLFNYILDLKLALSIKVLLISFVVSIIYNTITYLPSFYCIIKLNPEKILRNDR